ncbi:cytochrome c5 family protein [Aquaspirillum sp. LM1]|uniref:c-type cytochrome n=1 Tax=Aquaspirillum sp. LM1 TaxID=1938604 RepID=UPI0009840465|nr:c-type cytochrome [Aquaspirillum sp. LM1]AQR65967.1 cytochrome c5 family protein [Aquaspirillum sp. LM1]
MSSANKGSSSGEMIRVILSVLVLVVLSVWLLAKLFTSGMVVDAETMSKEAISARLKPVGVSVASEGGAPGSRNGETVYKAICASCHAAGLAGSPKFGDAGAWAGRISQGFDLLVKHAVEGIRGMPAKGGATDLTNDEVARAVAYMGNAAGGKFTEPKVEGAAGGDAKVDPAVKGKEIYGSVCMACHDTGAAGAPKMGDKAAWAPRIGKGLDGLVASATKGLNAMPPKGGYSGSDAEFRAAVEYIVGNSK